MKKLDFIGTIEAVSERDLAFILIIDCLDDPIVIRKSRLETYAVLTPEVGMGLWKSSNETYYAEFEEEEHANGNTETKPTIKVPKSLYSFKTSATLSIKRVEELVETQRKETSATTFAEQTNQLLHTQNELLLSLNFALLSLCERVDKLAKKLE